MKKTNATNKNTNANAQNANAQQNAQNAQKSAENAQNAQKRVTIAEYRETLLNDAVKRCTEHTTLALETAETARNKDNSANITNASAIVLVNANASACARVVEIYLHNKKHDVLFSKRVFERLTTATENDSETVKNARALIASYQMHIYKSKFRTILADDEKQDANSKLSALLDALHVLHITA